MKKSGQVQRIAKFEWFEKLDEFEKIWIDLEKLEKKYVWLAIYH